MQTNENDDYKKLARAIWWAKKHGYQMPALEQAVFDSAGAEPLRASLRRWAEGLVLSQDFARAVFGDEEVDEYGQYVIGLQVWAKQVAVELPDGKIMVAQPNQREVAYMTMQKQAEMLDRAMDDPTVMVIQPDITRLRLEDLYGTIPLRTHRLEGVQVVGAVPAWQWHLQQMVISDNVFSYLTDYIDVEMAKPERPKA